MKCMRLCTACLLALVLLGGCRAAPAGSEPPKTKENSGSLGEFTVIIQSAAVAADYHDLPALVVTYSFSNNSGNAAAFAYSIATKAYQHGIKLETGYSMDAAVMNTDNWTKSVAQGSTITVQCMYLLIDQTSPVTVEAFDLLDMQAAKLTKTFEIG